MGARLIVFFSVLIFMDDTYTSINPFLSNLHPHIPWKHHETFGFLIFSVVMEMKLGCMVSKHLAKDTF